jgi:hypothetical protein|tara:strand:+ start:175 stop:864 length:690 start_codon:yes stop_codon:yes gene_type:complete
MSTVKTDAIETRAGGTSVLTIGTATQTIKLPGGTPGADKVLKSDASGNATWGTDVGGSMVYLASSRSAVDAATVEFQSFKSSDYLYYKILGLMHTTVDSNYIYFRFMQGASIMTASSYYYISGGVDGDGTANHDSGAATASAMLFAQTDSSGMPQMFELNVRLQDASSVWTRSTFNGMVTGYAQANLMAERTVGGWYEVDNDAIDGCVFSYPSGDVDYHNIAVYGMKGS